MFTVNVRDYNNTLLFSEFRINGCEQYILLDCLMLPKTGLKFTNKQPFGKASAFREQM